jgi:cytidylate kinase
MNGTVLLERTDGYLHSQIRDSRGLVALPEAAAPFVTISREAGSGGSQIARLLVRKLNAGAPAGVTWRVVEESITTRMLEWNHLSRHLARYLPEDHVPEIAATVGELLGLHPNLWQLTEATTEAIRRLAATGYVVLVGRGANFATRNLPGGLHVRLVAPPDHRARFLAQQYNISVASAATHNARCDAARRRYVKAAFGTDIADTNAYDLVLNTQRLSLPTTADLIASHVRMLAGHAAP